MPERITDRFSAVPAAGDGAMIWLALLECGCHHRRRHPAAVCGSHRRPHRPFACFRHDPAGGRHPLPEPISPLTACGWRPRIRAGNMWAAAGEYLFSVIDLIGTRALPGGHRMRDPTGDTDDCPGDLFHAGAPGFSGEPDLERALIAPFSWGR